MSGFIIAHLPEFTYHDDDYRDRVSCYPTMDIGDCSEKISLDFSFYNPTQMKKALKKARLFREAVDGFVDAFESEVEKFQDVDEKLKRIAKAKEKKAKEKKSKTKAEVISE